MPGKHVRFAIPAYPSSSTTPSSPSHSTSTSHSYVHHHGHSPSRSSYDHHSNLTSNSYTSLSSSPTHYSRSLQIHKLLAYSRPNIHFDLRLPPNAITSSSSYLPSRVLSEPAISPPISSLTLSIPHLSPHWRVVVTPSNGVFITLSDVFSAIYYTLRTRVTESEYRAIRSPSDLKRVNAAYVERYRKVAERARDKYVGEAEKRGGVRRVDFLAGCVRFDGISVMADGRTFVLHLK
ncbi:hypothetical protein VKT23_009748 [Stygiomarasmius scandens]|uniref:DUF6699 domain-containing protein n=1 Tax=Marasmiellus scandens TaxID=2682957 RepID=A0ABR1JHC4_9AGAR